jgi:hypothetical protein
VELFKTYDVRLQLSTFGDSKALSAGIHFNSEMFLKHAKLGTPRARSVREIAGTKDQWTQPLLAEGIKPVRRSATGAKGGNQ